MFRVGMGGSPAIPEKLSAEGVQFLELCFVHDPKRRASAQQLQDHPFVKVRTAARAPPVRQGGTHRYDWVGMAIRVMQ